MRPCFLAPNGNIRHAAGGAWQPSRPGRGARSRSHAILLSRSKYSRAGITGEGEGGAGCWKPAPPPSPPPPARRAIMAATELDTSPPAPRPGRRSDHHSFSGIFNGGPSPSISLTRVRSPESGGPINALIGSPGFGPLLECCALCVAPMRGGSGMANFMHLNQKELYAL